MAVSLSLRQVTSVQPGPPPLYVVENSIVAASGIDMAVFVYSTATQKFDHYATVADMEAYPNNLPDAQIQNLPFYREVSVTRQWTTVEDMQDDLSFTQSRLQLLATDLDTVQTGLVGDNTVVISAGS